MSRSRLLLLIALVAVAVELLALRPVLLDRDGPIDDTQALPDPIELTAYFVASEALANVAKHAHASHATARLWRGDGRACIEVADDGIGAAACAGSPTASRRSTDAFASSAGPVPGRP